MTFISDAEASNEVQYSGYTSIGGDEGNFPSESPDSGSYTDFDAIASDRRGTRRSPRRTFHHSRPTVPRVRANGSFSESIFSPSPLGHSPISLMGGYLGISVPTTMNDISEVDEHQRPPSESQPLLKGYQTTNYVVTAIVEESAHRDQTGTLN